MFQFAFRLPVEQKYFLYFYYSAFLSNEYLFEFSMSLAMSKRGNQTNYDDQAGATIQFYSFFVQNFI